MWCDISNGNKPKDDMQGVAEGMTAGTLIWTTNGSYDNQELAGSYSAKPPGNVLRDHSGKEPQQRACSEQKCLDFAHSISLQEHSWNTTPLEDGQQPSAVITNKHSYFLPTTRVEYIRALNAPTSDGASRPPNKHIKEDSSMFMFTDTWTSIFCGCNLALPSNSIVYATH